MGTKKRPPGARTRAKKSRERRGGTYVREGGSADENGGRRGELKTVGAGAPTAAVEGDGSTVWRFDEGEGTNHSDRCGDRGSIGP